MQPPYECDAPTENVVPKKTGIPFGGGSCLCFGDEPRTNEGLSVLLRRDNGFFATGEEVEVHLANHVKCNGAQQN